MLHLQKPGTKENQELWENARKDPDGVLEQCNQLMKNIRKEQLEELKHLDDIRE